MFTGSEEKFTKIFNSTPVSIALLDFNEYRILEVNSAFEKLFGYLREECIGKTSKELDLYTDESTRHQIVSQITSGYPIDKMEINIKRKDGAVRIISTTCEIIETAGQKYYLFISEDITERKNSEIALLESESRLKEAQALAHLGNWDLDLINNVLHWSDEVYRIFGLQPQEFPATYEAFLDSVHPDDRVAVNNAYVGSINEGRDTYEIEHRIIRWKTGEIRYVQEKCRHFRDSEGKIIRSIGMVQDITEKERAKEALLASEERLETAFDCNPSALAISNISDGIILKVNKKFSEISGYSSEEIIGNTAIALNLYYHKEDRETALKILYRDNSVKELALRLRRKDSGIRIVLLSMEILKMNQGKSILTIIQDITERKRTEQKLKDSESKLLEAQKLAKLGTYLVDVESGTVDWSDEIYNIYELTKTEERITVEEIFRYTHPHDIDTIKSLFEEILRSKNNIEYEFRIFTPGKKLKYIYAYGKPVLSDTGTVRQIFGTVMDISERKINQLRLEGTLKELMRSNTDLEHFAYTASHDLQEPIRMISSYAQLIVIKNRLTLEDETREYLNYILEGAHRMQELVDDLLQYSRVSTKKKEFEKVDCNLIIKDVLKDLKLRIEEECAEFEISELPEVMGDATQLRQLFQNFLQNSLKFRSGKDPYIKI